MSGRRGVMSGPGANGYFPIPGLGDLNGGVYTDFTKGSLTGDRGGTWSLTRATATTGVDHESLVRTLLSGEARFEKLRRVENRVAGSSRNLTVSWIGQGSPTITANYGSVAAPDGSFSASRVQWTSGASKAVYQTLTSVAGEARTFSAWMRATSSTSTVRLRNYDGTTSTYSAALVLDTTWRRYSVSVTGMAASASANFSFEQDAGVSAADFLAWEGQLETVTGQAIQAPSENVSVGVLSAPYHGAGVDGVKYFNTANGNTVASNVVTEAAGAALDTATLKSGISPFGAHTALLLHNRDFTNAAWTKGATVTVAKDQTGADGTANGASRITFGAVGATNTVTQAVVSASAARYLTARIKRLVGTGVIEMSVDAGLSFVDVTSQISASYAKVSIPVQTLANPTAVFRGATNADAIAVDYVMLTSVANAPEIATTTAAVTVNKDAVTLDGTTLINQGEGGVWVKAVGPVDVATVRTLFQIDDGTANERVTLSRDASSKAAFDVVDGGASLAPLASVANWSAGSLKKQAGRYKLNDSNQAFDGTANTADTGCTMPTTTTLRLGGVAAGTEPNTTIAAVAMGRTGPSDANLAVSSA